MVHGAWTAKGVCHWYALNSLECSNIAGLEVALLHEKRDLANLTRVPSHGSVGFGG